MDIKENIFGSDDDIRRLLTGERDRLKRIQPGGQFYEKAQARLKVVETKLAAL